MNWKRYKSLPEKEKREEIYYIIGLDIGNDSSGIAFYNMVDKEPEIIDLSGGYGRPTIPTAIQYIVESKEWVFGEYAILNRGMGREITLIDLIERLGSSDYVDIDNRPVSLINLLGMYIKELLSAVKNINPKAEIAGIVASVPSYLSIQAREELVLAFKKAGYGKELIGLVSDRECVFSYVSHESERHPDGNSLLIDYGAREVRGGVYSHIDENTLKSLSSLFENNIGTRMIERQVKKQFTDYYKANNPLQAHQGLDRHVKEQLMAFTYQHKDILFQKAIRSKAAKLYFNFAFPPFQQSVDKSEADRLIEPFRKNFDQFIRQVLEKTGKVSAADIDVVICIGGGFEMLWAREALGALFPRRKLRLYKNSKAINAMGAAVAAAQLLGAAEGQPVTVEDRHQLAVDIGIMFGDKRFVPLAECNSFWWQPHPARMFIVNAPVMCGVEIPFEILSKSPAGETNVLSNTPLRDLPERPKGTTRLSVRLKFESDSEATATVSDCGFGEMFPRTGYEQEIVIKI